MFSVFLTLLGTVAFIVFIANFLKSSENEKDDPVDPEDPSDILTFRNVHTKRQQDVWNKAHPEDPVSDEELKENESLY